MEHHTSPGLYTTQLAEKYYRNAIYYTIELALCLHNDQRTNVSELKHYCKMRDKITIIIAIHHVHLIMKHIAQCKVSQTKEVSCRKG